MTPCATDATVAMTIAPRYAGRRTAVAYAEEQSPHARPACSRGPARWQVVRGATVRCPTGEGYPIALPYAQKMIDVRDVSRRFGSLTAPRSGLLQRAARRDRRAARTQRRGQDDREPDHRAGSSRPATEMSSSTASRCGATPTPCGGAAASSPTSRRSTSACRCARISASSRGSTTSHDPVRRVTSWRSSLASTTARRKLGDVLARDEAEGRHRARLVHDPPVLLLDEPATALDPEMSQMLRAFIVSLRARHRAILLCTHDLDEAQRIADRVVVVYRGRVARSGATDELRAAGRPSYLVTFVGDPRARAPRSRAPASGGGRTGEWSSGPALHARRSRDHESQSPPRAPRGWRTVLTLTREDRSLEDAYFSIVAQAKDG